MKRLKLNLALVSLLTLAFSFGHLEIATAQSKVNPSASAAKSAQAPATASATSAHASNAFFNEMLDEKNEIRPAYEILWKKMESLSASARQRFEFLTRNEFQGDNALDPMPRVLSDEEYTKHVRPGVVQRANALKAFLADFHSGKKTYEKAGIFPAGVVERIVARSAETQYQGMLTEETIAFLYGPDIIRGAGGEWLVIEDNPGFIGGMGDLLLARKLAEQLHPDFFSSVEVHDPKQFYDRITEYYKLKAKQKGGIAVVYQTPPYADQEDSRVRAIMEERGIITVTPFTDIQLSFDADGTAWVEDKSASSKSKTWRQKVGYIYVNGEFSWLEPSYPPNLTRALIEEAKSEAEELSTPFGKALAATGLKLRSIKAQRLLILQELIAKAETSPGEDVNQQIKKFLEAGEYALEIEDYLKKSLRVQGMTQSILKGHVGSNYVPGLDFIGDKEFYVYVEDLIRFYLGQEPILKNIPTERFSDHSGALRVDRLEHVMNNLKDYVIKKVDGRGGDAVWVGPKISEADAKSVREKVVGQPSEYIFQRFTPLSQLHGKIVDIRALAQVTPEGVIVTNTPWGRGLPNHGDGKVNLSANGREFAVVVTKPKPAAAASATATSAKTASDSNTRNVLPLSRGKKPDARPAGAAVISCQDVAG